MPTIIQRRRARQDVLETFEYLEERSSLGTAERFVASVLATYRELAAMSKMGIPCDFERPALHRLRRWPVQDFENWLIFFLPKRDGIEVLRVLHGARDLQALFS